MRILRVVFFIFALVAAASAAELKVKVVDPQSAAVPGAQVLLIRTNGAALRTATSVGDGTVSFENLPAGDYQVQVLAPGFARLTISVTTPRADSITAQLQLAPATEVVVVTATRTPVPAAESGASVALLDSAQLQVMQPLDASDALRFLPGAVVDTSGQRWPSLIVRARRRFPLQQGSDRQRASERLRRHHGLRPCPPDRGLADRIRSRRSEHALRFRRHDQRRPDIQHDRQHSNSRITLGSRWRKLQYRPRLCEHLWRARSWGLQPFWRSVQQRRQRPER